jgi:hypothetical protein
MVGCHSGRPASAPRLGWLTLSRAAAPGASDRGPWVAVAADGSVTADRWATTRPTASLDAPTVARLQALATAAANTDYLACRNAHAEYHYVLMVRSTVGPFRWAIAPGPGCLDDAPSPLRELVLALDRVGQGQAAF